MKLSELCKTRTKKSSPDLFKFYVISADHDMANDAGRATTCRRNFKARWLQTECIKTEGPSEKMNFNGETVCWFRTKKIKTSTPPIENITEEPQDPESKLNLNTCMQEELNWSQIDKIIQKELLELCKTRTKKSSPGLFNFYAISAGHDMANDNDRAITCRRNFKAPWLQTERTKNEGPSEKMSFNGETVCWFRQKNSKSPLLPWRQ